MPYEIDSEKLNSPDLKILDINHPPTRMMPHREYPRMVYLHPRDKTKEHRTKTVADSPELEAALAQGYKKEPHIPVAAVEDLSKDFEAEAPEHVRRGPGRPKAEAA
jgi:hypothetical protein